MAKLKSVYFCSSQARVAQVDGQVSCLRRVVYLCGGGGAQGSPRNRWIPVHSGAQERAIDVAGNHVDEEADTRDGELNRVLGGGLVPASVVLIGGEPGIGKSTLVLQTVLKLSGMPILYVSGEESARQLKLRAERIGLENEECLIVCETNLDEIFRHAKNVSPRLLVIDSIQTVYSDALESAPGSVSQVGSARPAAEVRKAVGHPVLLIGHITKEGHRWSQDTGH